ncbi:multiheme c-type cytochrome [Halarcobacter ebronensis]|uniref:Beta-ketoacyl-ACP synthase n=1 Tax=Halarcobacter ebronensis TaxID=1462615 RepID=A0A4V1LZT4_9BACT|nr:multiheme c-type cytochrome [Halarcobacter ebronensis]QKF82677.1 multiheme c-type cytochrome [Halarcobacter ebronensis]RXK02099.1 beta-ketoacyl-ACP synthase [Halarcobacter ebronensis]
MLKKLLLSMFASSVMLFAANVGDLSSVKTLKIDRDMTKMGKSCVECHAKETPGMVNDWKESRHGHVGISCIDCHQVKKDSPMATQACPGVKGTDVYISLLVTPKTCERCHPSEVKEFQESGHGRAGLQVHAKDGMQKLMNHFEGADNPHTKGSAEATGCMQCHGKVVELGKDNRPTAETWPQAGIGTIYPDGSVGNCASCHTRHKFSIAEARKPAACSSCHLGPDHPDKEIYDNSKHGHIFNAEGNEWKYDSAPDAWEPGDYRAPTCATCHMSGIGDLKTTHNVSRRLKWNLWAPKSNLRDGGLDNAVKVWKEEGKFSKGNPVAGHPDGSVAARAEMEKVCSSCHSTLHTKNFFEMADKHVILYNESYFEPAKKMYDELKAKGLIAQDPWTDEFHKVYYHLWHHQGRRMRQGALMNGPDYAHWHGVFELQQDIRELKKIYEHRMKTGKID